MLAREPEGEHTAPAGQEHQAAHPGLGGATHGTSQLAERLAKIKSMLCPGYCDWLTIVGIC